jgi:hypothetical protein
MRYACLSFGLVAIVSMPLANCVARAQSGESEKSDHGTSNAALLEFQDLDGKTHHPLRLGKARAAAIIFVLQDCPISNKYAPEIQRLADQFSKQRINFYLVHVDPQLSTTDAKRHAKDYGYKLPIILDRKHELVRRCKATTAPEVVVIGPNEKPLYRGRIDDRYAALGKPRQQVQRRDLHLALESIVAGKPIEIAETKPIGCYIPELDD